MCSFVNYLTRAVESGSNSVVVVVVVVVVYSALNCNNIFRSSKVFKKDADK